MSRSVLDDRELAMQKIAGMTGFNALDFSRIRDADLGRFTLDQLVKMLAALDGIIKVRVHVGPRHAMQAVTPSPC